VHTVVALALPAVEAFDLAIPAQVFADPGLPRRYDFTVCAPAAGLVRSTAGFSLQAEHGLEALAAVSAHPHCGRVIIRWPPVCSGDQAA
jgi:AraC family transcriptional regulator, transcriptional activator FtrA